MLANNKNFPKQASPPQQNREPTKMICPNCGSEMEQGYLLHGQMRWNGEKPSGWGAEKLVGSFGKKRRPAFRCFRCETIFFNL